MSYQIKRATSRIVDVLTNRAEFSDEDAFAIAFHLSDWAEELARFAAFLENPESRSDEEVYQLLIDLLIHAPYHMSEADKVFRSMEEGDDD